MPNALRPVACHLAHCQETSSLMLAFLQCTNLCTQNLINAIIQGWITMLSVPQKCLSRLRSD